MCASCVIAFMQVRMRQVLILEDINHIKLNQKKVRMLLRLFSAQCMVIS